MIKYVEILFRNRLRFLILLLILPAELSVGAALLYPHNSAVSSLWVDTPTYFSVSPAATGWSQYLTPAQNTVDAIDQMVKTDAFYKTLNTQLFDEHTFKNAGERDATMSSLSTDLRIATAGSHLVTLSHTCVRTAICINVLNATVGIYRTWFAGQQRSQATVAIDFYTRQLTDEQAKLAAAQKALTAYAAANPNRRGVGVIDMVRAAAEGRPPRASGDARPAHGPRQPHALRGAAGASRVPSRPERPPRGRPLPRSRRVQGRERRLRPPVRRPGALRDLTETRAGRSSG